jgi:hypothetical protein
MHKRHLFTGERLRAWWPKTLKEAFPHGSHMASFDDLAVEAERCGFQVLMRGRGTEAGRTRCNRLFVLGPVGHTQSFYDFMCRVAVRGGTIDLWALPPEETLVIEVLGAGGVAPAQDDRREVEANPIINTSLRRRKEEDSSDSELGATDKDAEDFLRDPKREGPQWQPGAGGVAPPSASAPRARPREWRQRELHRKKSWTTKLHQPRWDPDITAEAVRHHREANLPESLLELKMVAFAAVEATTQHNDP